MNTAATQAIQDTVIFLMVFYSLLIVFIVINFIKHMARLKKLRIQRDKNNVEIKKILDKMEIQSLTMAKGCKEIVASNTCESIAKGCKEIVLSNTRTSMAKDWENIEKDFIAISRDIDKAIYGE